MSFFAVDLWLPPASLGLVALLALLVPGRWGRRIAALALIGLVALSMPAVGLWLLGSLDLPPQPADPGAVPQAIVILSADVERTADGADLGGLTLERERAGAALAKRSGLPVLVTGGLVTAPPPVAEMMATSLRTEFGVPVRWVENRSLTTWENARFSVPMLQADGIRLVYLVTHSWHMRRSVLAFERAGMAVVPVPIRPVAAPEGLVTDWVPRVSAWARSYLALHEWAGLVQYRLRAS